MSLPAFPPTSKAKIRLRPSVIEGRYIRFVLALRNISLTIISKKLDLSVVAVSRVLIGQIRSARVENEVARLLGKTSWNDVVTEAREATKAFAEPPRSTPRGKRRSA